MTIDVEKTSECQMLFKISQQQMTMLIFYENEDKRSGHFLFKYSKPDYDKPCNQVEK